MWRVLAAVAWSLSALATAHSVDGLPPLPRLLYWNETLLARTRSLLAANSSAVVPALTALLSSVEAELLEGPWSVTSQTGAGPGNATNRTYVSIAPYWWPCVCSAPPDGAGCSMPPPPSPAAAAQLARGAAAACNSTTGLPWTQHDGVFNTHAIELFRARAAWGNFSAHFQNVTLAYALTGDERLAARAAQWARAFFVDPALSMLPNLDHGQYIPGVTAGRGIGVIDFSQYMTLGFLDGLLVLRSSPSWADSDEAGVQAWMSAFLGWLQTSPVALEEAATTNNHLTFYRALVQAAALFTGDAAAAAGLAAADGTRVLDVQVAADGSLPQEDARTRSLHYVTFDLHALQALALTAGRSGVDLWRHPLKADAGAPAIAAALDYVAAFAVRGGATWPFPQLDAFSYAEMWDIFALAAVAYPEGPYLGIAGALAQAPAADDQRRLLWPLAAAPAAETSAALPPWVVTSAAVAGALLAAAGGGVVLQRHWGRGRGGLGETAALLGGA